MNPTLALLLSSLYDGGLVPEHRADLEKSGVTDETIRTHFIRRVPPDVIGRLLGFEQARGWLLDAVQSARLFPYRALAGGFMDHGRMKIYGFVLPPIPEHPTAAEAAAVAFTLDETASRPYWR